MKPSDLTLEEQSDNYCRYHDRIDPKEALENLIRQDGFSHVAKTLGEVAANEESLIRIRNDFNLRFAFELLFCALVDCYKGAGKKNKMWIENLMQVDAVKYSLDLCEPMAEGQYQAIKGAYQTVKSWENK